MKTISLFFVSLLGLCTQSFAASESFKVYEQDYMFSKVFEMSSNEGLSGSVCKSFFRVRTNYDLYDRKGEFEAMGICRVLTLGLIYSWATEMDIYGQNGQYIGLVDGQMMTTAEAKFSLYDASLNRIGIVYLDETFVSFTIVDPNNERHVLASLKRNFIADTVDNWDVNIYEKEAVDLRMIKIFAAFAVDTQKAFKADL